MIETGKNQTKLSKRKQKQLKQTFFKIVCLAE